MRTSETLSGDSQSAAPNDPGRFRSTHKFLPIAWVLSLLTATTFAVILPRPTYPQILPMPKVDLGELREREQGELARAKKVASGTLSWETRAIGEQVRRIGKATARGAPPDPGDLALLRSDVGAELRRKGGEEALLHLRALQAQLFLDAVANFESTGEPNPELYSLGGPFFGLAKGAWVDEKGQMILQEDELRLSFRVYWSRLTGLLDVAPFRPTLSEYRRYYRTNLLSPPAPPSDGMNQLLAQLAMARALGRVDPAYPGRLAEGMLQIRLGQYKEAELSLQAFVSTHPKGPWTQIAKNHFLFAIKEAQSLEL